MTSSRNRPDPKGLLREAYRMEGLGDAECRSIFIDWAMSLPEEVDAPAAVAAHHGHFAKRFPDHPMTAVLREGMTGAPAAKRRGGSRGRRN